MCIGKHKKALAEHNALITKADKDSSIVTWDIQLLNENRTIDYSKEINRPNAIYSSKTLLIKNKIISLETTNPQAPILRGLPVTD